jgi:hypothetical protein
MSTRRPDAAKLSFARRSCLTFAAGMIHHSSMQKALAGNCRVPTPRGPAAGARSASCRDFHLYGARGPSAPKPEPLRPTPSRQRGRRFPYDSVVKNRGEPLSTRRTPLLARGIVSSSAHAECVDETPTFADSLPESRLCRPVCERRDIVEVARQLCDNCPFVHASPNDVVLDHVGRFIVAILSAEPAPTRANSSPNVSLGQAPGEIGDAGDYAREETESLVPERVLERNYGAAWSQVVADRTAQTTNVIGYVVEDGGVQQQGVATSPENLERPIGIVNRGEVRFVAVQRNQTVDRGARHFGRGYPAALLKQRSGERAVTRSHVQHAYVVRVSDQPSNRRLNVTEQSLVEVSVLQMRRARAVVVAARVPRLLNLSHLWRSSILAQVDVRSRSTIARNS